MTRPSHVHPEAVLVMMFTTPAFSVEHAERLARLYTAQGFVAEVTKAEFNGYLLNAVHGYAIEGE